MSIFDNNSTLIDRAATVDFDPADQARGELLKSDVLAGRLDAFRVVTVSKADAFGFLIACLRSAAQFDSICGSASVSGVPLSAQDIAETTKPSLLIDTGFIAPNGPYARKDSGTPLALPLPVSTIFMASRGAARALVRGSVDSSSPVDWQPLAGAPGEGSPVPGVALPGIDPAAAAAAAAAALGLPSVPTDGDALGALPVVGILLTVGGVAAIAAGAWYLADRHRANVGLEVEKMKVSAEIALRTTAISASIAAGKPIDPSLVTGLAAPGQSEERSGLLVGAGILGVLGLVAAGVARGMGKI